MASPPLSPNSRPTSHATARIAEKAAWDIDAIFEGLLSGKISGTPMDLNDANLLLTLLEKLGWSPDAGRLADAMPYFVDQLDVYGVCSIMRHLGYRCNFQNLRGDSIPRGHPTGIIVGPDDRIWTVDDTKKYVGTMRRSGLSARDADVRLLNPLKTYSYVYFEIDPSLSDLNARRLRQSFSTDTISRFMPDLRLALLLTLMSGVLTILFSAIVIFLFDLVLSGQQTLVIGAVLAAAGALFLFDLGFRSLKARLLGRISGRFEFLLGRALFDKLLKLPRQMIDQAPVSEQTVRLRELEGIRDVFAGPFAIVALEIPGTLLLIAVITYFSPVLGLLLVGLIIVFMIAGLCLIPSLVRRAAILSDARGALTRIQIELIEKQHVIARNGLAWPWARKAERALGTVVSARFRLARSASRLEALSYLFLPTAAASVIFIGAERAIAGLLSGGELIAVTMLTWRAVAPIQQGLIIMPKVGDLLRLFKQIDTMMRFAEEENLPGIEKTEQQAGKLTTANIFLRRPQAHAPTLAGVSLEIPKGLFVSVTGASGSGKSTLLSVLSGQTQPQAGSVRLDDISISEMSNHALAQCIMLVPPKPLLIYGTLAQNLRFVDPLVSDEKIDDLLSEVGLSRLIERMPNGIHNRIDPALDEALLSGGVRTAVAVAQALLIKPSVLLLDEASEDIDPVVDEAIMTAIKNRRDRMTSLVVTHRPSTIRDSDAVLKITGGRAGLNFNSEKWGQAI